MTREEEIARYCEDMGFPLGSCSSINSVKSITASGAIKWADKTMIEKACEWLNMNIIDYITEGSREGISLENQKQMIEDFRKAMEE